MITLHANGSRMIRRITQLRRSTKAATPMAAGQVASHVCHIIVRLAPRDTNHYVRGWQWANSMIDGGKPMPVSGISESRYSRQNRHRLLYQARRMTTIREKWDRIVRGIEAQPNHQGWKSYRRAKQVHGRVTKMESIAWEQFRAIDQSPAARSAIVIGGRAVGRNPYRTSTLARVSINLAPRGDARMVRFGDRVYWQVRNLQPHTYLVEKRTRVMRGALMLARSGGLTITRQTYVKAFGAGGGFGAR